MFYELKNKKIKNSGNNWIAPNATIIGDVTLEKNTSIWFNATLRGDIENILIGEGSNVQDGSVLHTDPGYPLKIGKNVTIGHMVMLHGCTIGDNSLVGIKENYLNFFLSKLKLKIFYLKFDNDIGKIFDKIDVVVFPSYREGASKTLMEACSFGKVIMAADVPGCNNIVFHKQNGLLFKSRSSKSIYTSMENILKNKSKLKKMSQFSFNFAREKLDQNKIIKLMEKHY